MAVEELTNPVFSPYVDTLTLFIPNIQLGGLGIFWRFRAGFKSSFARCLVLQRSTYSKWIGVTWKIQSEKKNRDRIQSSSFRSSTASSALFCIQQHFGWAEHSVDEDAEIHVSCVVGCSLLVSVHLGRCVLNCSARCYHQCFYPRE